MKPLSSPRIMLLTILAMLAFAGNSLLCRMALKHTEIDATRRRLVWSLWLITWLGLLAGLVFQQWYEFVVWFSVVHALFFIYLERFNLMAFPVQVRLAYSVWVAIGTYVPYTIWLMWLTTIGLAANLFANYCPLARMLSLLPFNRREPFSFDLVKRVFLSPPMQGQFVPPEKGFAAKH